MMGRNSDSLKRYYEDGTLEYESYHNENGQEQGNVKYYYPNGQVQVEYESQNGITTGKVVRYYENGDEKYFHQLYILRRDLSDGQCSVN